MDRLNTAYTIDENGELIKVNKPTVSLDAGDSVRTKNQKDYYRMKQMQTKVQNDYGVFTFLLYSPAEKLNLNILPASLTRLMYLSTFLSYNGWLVTDQNQSIDKGLCREILNVSDDTFLNFWNEMLRENIFTYKNERIYLNKDIFVKGELKNNTKAMRLNCETVRYLYEHCQSISGHKNLSYIFKIIPWVNRTWNIVCWNPEEKERKFVEYMKLGDFAEKVGYNRAHAKKLAEALKKVKFRKYGEYKDKSAFLYVIDDSFKPDEWLIIINPLVFYAGDNYQCVKGFEF